MRKWLPWAFGGLGVVLVAVGAISVATFDGPQSMAFGWYAYAPLDTTAAYESRLDLSFDADAGVVWTAGWLVGVGLIALGLVLLAALVGWAIGRRSGRRIVRH